MELDSSAPAPARWARHPDRPARVPQIPKVCCAPVREGSPRTGGKHSRHPYSPLADAPVAKSEHATMQRYEMAPTHTVTDQASAEANLEELLPRKDSVLTFR